MNIEKAVAGAAVWKIQTAVSANCFMMWIFGGHADLRQRGELWRSS